MPIPTETANSLPAWRVDALFLVCNSASALRTRATVSLPQSSVSHGSATLSLGADCLLAHRLSGHFPPYLSNAHEIRQHPADHR